MSYLPLFGSWFRLIDWESNSWPDNFQAGAKPQTDKAVAGLFVVNKNVDII